MIAGFLFILGCVIGSFLNVLIDRLPDDRWPTGRSMCDGCGRILAPFELVPILSWLIQKGRSICCHKQLSAWYPVVEVVTGIVYVLLAGKAILFYILASAFIVIFFADLKYHIIPDAMTVVVTVVALLLTGREHLVAGLGMCALFYVVYWLSREKGLGFGDVKFAFPMGLLLGFYNALIAVYIACILGGLVGAILVLGQRKKLKSMIAFGPFLILGTLVMLFFEKDVWALIHRLFLL
jgi:prepilin signal peptidase PulO-like enzyme (type II secretory pathway)